MAPYTFPRYYDESLYVARSLQLETVELEFQESGLAPQFSNNSDPQIWKYGSTKHHTYTPEELVKVPIRSTNALASLDLFDYAWSNRNSYFPPDLIGLSWLNENTFGMNIAGASIYGTSLFLATHHLTSITQASTQPKPPDRWKITFTFITGHRSIPSYENLITGYNRDIRVIPDRLKITPISTQTVTVKYYRNDPYEHIPNREYIDIDRVELPVIVGDDINAEKSRLKSINWHTQDIELIANTPLIIDIKGIVLGTLVTTPVIDESTLLSWHSDLSQPLYPAKYLLNTLAYLDELFDYWALLFNDRIFRAAFGQSSLAENWLTDKRLPLTYSGFNVFASRQTSLAITEGFNNYWNNYQLPEYTDYRIRPSLLPHPDVPQRLSFIAYKILEYHPFFKSLPLLPVPVSYPPFTIDVDHIGSPYTLSNAINPDARLFRKAYDNYHPFNHANLLNWHLKPQIFDNINRGIGTIPMDTVRTIEIHKALDAGKYAVNELDITRARITTLGWHIENQSRVLGLRRDADGEIDREREEDIFMRKTLNKPRYDKRSYAMNSWGDYGYVLPHLGNISNNPKDEPYDLVYDFPQMLAAMFEHLNKSLGIQQGTKIELINPINGKKDNYPNQLAMQLSNTAKITEANQNIRELYNLVTVASQEQRELFSGIGIPITQKTLYNRYGSFPYVGHQSGKGSMNTQLTTIKSNLGIVLGNQLVKPTNNANPLERFGFYQKENK